MPKISGSYYGNTIQPQFQTYPTAGMIRPATTTQPVAPTAPTTPPAPVIPSVPPVTTVGPLNPSTLSQGMMAPERESLIKAILMAAPR